MGAESLEETLWWMGKDSVEACSRCGPEPTCCIKTDWVHRSPASMWDQITMSKGDTKRKSYRVCYFYSETKGCSKARFSPTKKDVYGRLGPYWDPNHDEDPKWRSCGSFSKKKEEAPCSEPEKKEEDL